MGILRARGHLHGIKYVIFPESFKVQIWDFIMILSIWYCALCIPFRFGISGGYYIIHYDGFWIFNIFINVAFIVDTILSFFRAYRDQDGRIVCTLDEIGWHYIRSGWFFVNLLASIPDSNVLNRGASELMTEDGSVDVLSDRTLRVFFILDLFKLLRLLRIKPLMASSEVVLRFWEQINIEVALTLKFVFMIAMISHWLACTWGFVAYLEAGTFGREEFLENLNWLSNWYNNSYIEGAFDPIGWENAMSRYWMCLFWAIQSITSIGYGTIAPVTNAEYICLNVLMLLCGIFWAYVIGNLVEVVTSMGNIHREYTTRLLEANCMLNDFTAKSLPESITGIVEGKKSSKMRIRRFLSDQQYVAKRSNLQTLKSSSVCSLQDAYPTLSILSPELQHLSALHLMYPYLETIPFLSSKYLSPEEQASVALQCVTMEFSKSERFIEHPEYGRGIIIFRRGLAIVSRPNKPIKHDVFSKLLVKCCLDVYEVLVDDDHYKEHRLVHHFLGYSKVLFVPRSVIMAVFEKNKRAWKECARWRYLASSLHLYALGLEKQRADLLDFLHSHCEKQKFETEQIVDTEHSFETIDSV